MRTFRIALRLGAVLLAVGPATEFAAGAQSNEAPASAGAKPTALIPDQVLVKGKGVEVKRSQLDEAVIAVKANMATQGRALSSEESAMVEKQVLDRMIQIRLLLSKATEADQVKGKELCDKRFDEAKKRAGSEEALQRQLKATGLTEALLRSRMTEEATAEVVLERELKVSVTDAEVKKFYDENPGKFEQPEMVRASHILIGTRDAAGSELGDEAKKEKKKKAEEVLKRVKGGEDFAKLVKENSDDQGSKDRGGEYTFPRGQMVPEFEAAAFSLGTNQISDLVTTQFGYHIIKVSEKIPAKKVELAKVTDDVRQFLKGEDIRKQLPDFLDKARKEADIEILDEKLKLPPKPATPAPAPVK